MANTLYVCKIYRDEIESMDLSSVKNFVNKLEKIGKVACQSCAFMVDGYDHIPDELFEIPEVMAFHRKVVEKFPYILYYLSPEVEGTNLILCAISNELLSFHRGPATLSNLEYARLGINPITDLPKKHIYLKVDVASVERMKKAIRAYGKRVRHNIGAQRVIEMLDSLNRTMPI